MNALFADDCGPDQRHGEVDRWYLFLNSSIRLSECGYLTGKPFAGSSWQIDNPATSPSPLPIHSDLRTAKIKHSRSERSRFAEPAHIAAEMIVATHKRTRCVLKRFADGSQPTLLGVLLSTVLAPSAVSSIHMSKIKKSLRSDSLAQATQDRSVRGGNHEPQHSGERFQLTLSRKPPGHTPRPLPVVVSLVVLTPTPSLRPRRHRCRCSPPSPPSPTRLANPSCRYMRRSDRLTPCTCVLLILAFSLL